ncbi:MAG: SDR family NAD(P)-dependent oxidoreductase [Propionibacteriaceae bacterium]|jgi:short-subunit dehydrogenase|nr:SDR family NAD(P)-dependent oxidoreductase [Propionibacteriaceae bacterium]
MTTALVTGGTSGLGEAFAHELARRGNNIVLVARDEEALASVATVLHAKYGVDVEILRADLAHRDQTAVVVARLLDQEHPVDTLVNNAGFGLYGSLLAEDLSEQERAMEVMVHAVLLLSNAAARAMAVRGSGTIINISSSSAWIYTGNYSAIKSWVLTFTKALAVELEGTGVRVVASCPGWAKTNFHSRAGQKRPSLPAWAYVPVASVPRDALACADSGKVVSVPHWPWKIAIWVAQHGPQSIPRSFARKITNSRKK